MEMLRGFGGEGVFGYPNEIGRGVYDSHSPRVPSPGDILRLMRKGVTAIQNIQTLKWCFEHDVEASWNILYGFPGERASQYDRPNEKTRPARQLKERDHGFLMSSNAGWRRADPITGPRHG